MKVERIDHVHAHVKDADAAIKLFGELFGSEFDPLFESEEWGVRTCFHPLGIDLIQPTDPNGEAAQLYVAGRGEGLLSISLKVPDMDEAIAEMESRGIKMISSVQIGRMKEALFDYTNTFGVQIELCEYPGDSTSAAAAMEP